MTHGKLLRYLALPLVAVLVFWWGGFFYFKGSSDWQEVKALLFADPAIQARVGAVKDISLGPFPFMYRFSGDYVRATLRVTVIGSSGRHQATIEMEKRDGRWSFVS